MLMIYMQACLIKTVHLCIYKGPDKLSKCKLTD